MNLLLTLLLLVATAFGTPPLIEDYRIGPGDVLRIEVYGETFGGVFQVGSTGAVSFPHVGSVQVGGRTVFEAEDALRAALLDGYLVDPQISVRVEEYRSQRIEVMGAVQKPGPYYLEGETTLRTLLGMSGGVQGEKAVGRVVVSRRNGEKIVVPLTDLEGQGGSLLLAAGDVVAVDEGLVVFVGGEVSKPGAVGFVDGMTVTEALIKAGGRTNFANLSGSYILRNGERISVNLKKVLKGKGADLVLEPGDQLVVPESPI